MHGNVTRIRKRPPRAVLLSVAALAVLIASALGYYLLAGDGPTGSIYTTASDVSSPDVIRPIEITVIDGDTIRARGKTIRNTAPRGSSEVAENQYALRPCSADNDETIEQSSPPRIIQHLHNLSMVSLL